MLCFLPHRCYPSQLGSSQKYPDPLDLLSFPNRADLDPTQLSGFWHPSEKCSQPVQHELSRTWEQPVLALTIQLFNLPLSPTSFFWKGENMKTKNKKITLIKCWGTFSQILHSYRTETTWEENFLLHDRKEEACERIWTTVPLH